VTGDITGRDLVALTEFLHARVPQVQGPVRIDLLPGGRSNLTYRITYGDSSWVLRRGPLGVLTPSAHDMAREFQVVAALYDTEVPVARPVIYCADLGVLGVPFSVVEHVAGTVIRTREDLAAYSDGELARCAFALIDMMVALHRVDYVAAGLADFGRPGGYLARQVARWQDQWQRVATRPVPDVDALYRRLMAATPAESAASIVHGDLRIDNVILDSTDVGVVRALVDWEMATLGDPLADLGLHVVYCDPAFAPVLGGSAASTSERLPGADALIDRYVAATGLGLATFDFCVSLGYFKSAVIAEGIHARHLRGEAVGGGYASVGAAVPELAAHGLRALRASRS
jgi:aminoglycoside phosphotransferase (APT) family kinase protein